ncbi:hypothetical protein QQF64_008417 [Cirrhinus molitorella]|uniref:Thioredoxin domain-containing protein 17 n=1 Tax=Cirrhinus molitorella TaxID=172907 RepID=A0ABR3M7H9_9TELE
MSKYEDVAVHGYEEFCKAVSERKGKDIIVYFSGDKDDQGKSWCPDCVKAEPVVRGELSHLMEGSVFIYCQVGDRSYWKDPNNDFKKTLKLTGVPTLLRYGTPQKLVEEECFKADLHAEVQLHHLASRCRESLAAGAGAVAEGRSITGAHSLTPLTVETHDGRCLSNPCGDSGTAKLGTRACGYPSSTLGLP